MANAQPPRRGSGNGSGRGSGNAPPRRGAGNGGGNGGGGPPRPARSPFQAVIYWTLVPGVWGLIFVVAFFAVFSVDLPDTPKL
jgi:hypothetical protein